MQSLLSKGLLLGVSGRCTGNPEVAPAPGSKELAPDMPILPSSLSFGARREGASELPSTCTSIRVVQVQFYL